MKTIINTITKKDFNNKEVDFKNLITNIEDWTTWKYGLFNMKSKTIETLRIPRVAEIISINVHDDLHMEVEYFMNGIFYNVKSYLMNDSYKLEKGKMYIVETHSLEDLKREELDFASNIIEFVEWNEYKKMMLDDKTDIYIARATDGNLKKQGDKVNKIAINDNRHLEIEYFNDYEDCFYNSKSYMFIA